MLRGRNDTGDGDPMAYVSMNTKILSKKTALQDSSWEIVMNRIKHTAAFITAGLICATGATAQTDQATIDKALSPLPMDLRADATRLYL